MSIRHKIATVWKTARNSFQALMLHRKVIRSFVWQSLDGTVDHSNWGDDINYFFLKEIVDEPLIMASTLQPGVYRRVDNYLGIGSIIGMISDERSIVWGSGIIDSTLSELPKPKRICAVRGPKTREKLLELGYDCPEIYGDPALLLPLHYNPQRTQKHNFGIIPHFSEFDIAKGIIPESEEVHYIKAKGYDDWHEFINEILESEVVLTSSLHGLIVSEAYGVPCVWVEFDGCKPRDRFKYDDFYLSIGKSGIDPVIIKNADQLKELAKAKANWRKGEIDLNPLISACPLKLKKNALKA